MIRLAAFAAATAVLLATAAPAQADDEKDLARLLLTATSDFQKRECKMSDWERIIAHPRFSALPSRIRSSSYLMPVLCGVGGKRTPDLIGAATAEPDASALAWSIRFLQSAATDQRADALQALETTAEKSGDQTAEIHNDELVFDFWRRLKDDKVARRRMASALDRIDWRPAGRTFIPDPIWLAQARALLDAGDKAGAERFLRKLSHPESMVQVRIDRRFETIVEAQPDAFDVKFAALATLAANQAELQKNPADAEALQAVAYDLRMLGRFGEALDVLDAGLKAPVLRNSRGDDGRNWVANERAYTLADLGRYDEAVKAMREASGENERGGVNVSQTINLASVLNEVGRYQEALDALAPLSRRKDRVSPYGQMWIAFNRVCAHAGLGQIAQAKAEMAYVEQHAEANRSAHRDAATCIGDEEAIARSLIAQLTSDAPEKALVLFSKSRIETPPRPPRAKLLAERLAKAQQRPDVQAAFSAIGRADTFDVYLDAMQF